MANIEIPNLNACIDDAANAGRDSDPGPAEPNDYNNLVQRLDAARDSLPPLYTQAVYDPYVQVIKAIGQNVFETVLAQDPQRVGLGAAMMDIAHAILQNAENYQVDATDAFQEVISDLYDGFLSSEDRANVKPPDRGVIPPLVKWGNPDFGPYTFSIRAMEPFNVKAAIVSLPPANGRGGLMAWTALPHETAGHDILGADTGLRGEMIRAVDEGVRRTMRDAHLSSYWSGRIDETAADVLGLMNMGPAAGIGLIAYFRGLSRAFNGPGELRSNGPENDSHPADVLRGYLAAEVMHHLSFEAAEDWADLIEEETDKDVHRITLAGQVVSKRNAKLSARVVADVLINTPYESLEHHRLSDFLDWNDADEDTVSALSNALVQETRPEESLREGFYAAHAVAAAALAALKGDLTIDKAFAGMVRVLKRMHESNPAWAPLFSRLRGDVHRHRFYIPQQ